MALINCPDCGREVSSRAPACPECGYPVGNVTPVPAAREPQAVRDVPKTPWWKVAVPIVLRLFVGGMLAGIGGGEEESVAAVMGGIIIAGSAIPFWYRTKIEGMKARHASLAATERIEERMAEIEYQQREALSQLARAQQAAIAELEERLEFTERMMIAKRDEIGPN